MDLHTAAKTGNLARIGELLQQGCDVNARDIHKRTPLHLACWAGQLEAVKVLLHAPSSNKKIGAMDDMNAVHFACQKGHTEIVRHLINAGIHVNAKTRKGITALHIACQNGHNELAQFLLSRKANVFAKDRRDESPLAKCKDDNLRELIQAAIDKETAQSQFKKRKRDSDAVATADVEEEEDEDDGIQLKPARKAVRPPVVNVEASSGNSAWPGDATVTATRVQASSEAEQVPGPGLVDANSVGAASAHGNEAAKASTDHAAARDTPATTHLSVAPGPLAGGRPPVAGGPKIGARPPVAAGPASTAKP